MCRISVEVVDQRQQFRLGGRGRQVVVPRGDARLPRRRCACCAHRSWRPGRCPPGRPPAPAARCALRAARSAIAAAHFRADLPGNGTAIDQLGGHDWRGIQALDCAGAWRQPYQSRLRHKAARVRSTAQLTAHDGLLIILPPERGAAIMAGLEVRLARRGMAQSGSASALGAEGRRFESVCPDQLLPDAVAEVRCRTWRRRRGAPVAQRIEHRPSKPGVAGSIPARRANRWRIWFVAVECDGGRSSVGRAPDCDSGRRGFESHRPPQSA